MINSSKSITLDMETGPICDGTVTPIIGGVGAASADCAADLVTEIEGSFADAGTNAAWPTGVQMSFEGTLAGTFDSGVAIGFGAPAEECGVTAPTGGARRSAPTCYAGLVTYRSTNRRYPNTAPIGDGLTNCVVGVGASSLANIEGASTAIDRMSDSRRKELSGLALVMMYDSDRNARANNGDTFLLISLCGPFSNQPAKAGVLDGATSYSYATCPAPIGGGVGGVIPVDGSIGIDLGEFLTSECMRPITSGNIKVKLAPTTTAAPTTLAPTTLPETTLPETTLPETTLPETTLPETTLPETTLPETTLPETTLPETTLPATTLPETTIPG